MIFFQQNFFKYVVNRKEPELEPVLKPEPLFVSSAPAPGGNLISALRLQLHKTTTLIKGWVLVYKFQHRSPVA